MQTADITPTKQLADKRCTWARHSVTLKWCKKMTGWKFKKAYDF